MLESDSESERIHPERPNGSAGSSTRVITPSEVTFKESVATTDSASLLPPVRHRLSKRRVHRVLCWTMPQTKKKSFLFPQEENSEASDEERDTMKGGKYSIVRFWIHSYHNPAVWADKGLEKKQNLDLGSGTDSKVSGVDPGQPRRRSKKALPNNVGADVAPPKTKPLCMRVCGCAKVKVRSHSTQTPFSI